MPLLVSATPISAVTTPSDGLLNLSSEADDLSYGERPTRGTNESVASSPSTDGIDLSATKQGNATFVDEGTKNEYVKPIQSQSQRTEPLLRNERNSKYDDEQTYLDLFGERAKELLTQHIIPATDTKCRWDWRMGRCEPYCECGYYFLWGDYHLGRSCRLRSKITPLHHSGSEKKTSTASLQDAWQQWADHSAKRSPSEVDGCNLPPESRYTQAVYYLTQLLGHGTFVLHQFQKVKHRAVKTASDVLTHGNRRFTNVRENACLGLKKLIEERERGRNQPIVLTRRGNIWIRRLCVIAGNTVPDEANDDDQKIVADGEVDESS
ncbi:hypothetical protein ACHAW6_009860 [Cyclotella cf. meneghiniana]